MALVLILIGAVLIVAAFRDTQGDLFAALKEDVPPFAVWAAAIVAVGAVGFVPGLKPISRGLLALVIVVLIINNYQKIIAGFNNAWQGASAVGTATASNDNSSAAAGSGGVLGTGLNASTIFDFGTALGL